jgi:hypothetical protein
MRSLKRGNGNVMHRDDERKGYEEDHSDRDDYPEEVWEEMQLEKWRAEHGSDDDYLNEEPDPDFEEERLEKLAQGNMSDEEYEEFNREILTTEGFEKWKQERDSRRSNKPEDIAGKGTIT